MIIALLLLLALPFLMMLNAFVFQCLWAWFAVDVLAVGLPALTFVQCLGVMFLYNYINFRPSGEAHLTEEQKEKQRVETLIVSFLYPPVALGIGKILHLILT